MRSLIRVLLVAVLLYSCDNEGKERLPKTVSQYKIDNNNSTTIKIGDKIDFEDFKVVNLSGQALKNNNSKLTIIDFWATWCGPCIQAFPHLENLQKKYEDKVEIVAISDESIEKIKTFQNKKEFELSFYSNKEKGLFKLFGIEGLPTTVILSEQGEFVWADNSEELDAVLSDYIEQGKFFPKNYKNKVSRYSKYYTDFSSSSNVNNNTLIYSIAESNKESIYEALPPKKNGLPVRIEYVNTPLLEIIKDLNYVNPKEFQNKNEALNNINLDIKVLSKSKNITSAEFIPKVLNDLELLYSFKVIEKIVPTKVYNLNVVDESKLGKYSESISGGGMARIENEKIFLTRLSLDNISEYLGVKTKNNYGMVINDTNKKYNIIIDKEALASFEILEKELFKYGITIKNSIENIRHIEVL